MSEFAPSGRTRVHAFTDDALGEHDAVALAELVRGGTVDRQELALAAAARSRAVEDTLYAIAFDARSAPRYAYSPDGPLDGVPTFVKDNTDVGGMPTNHGSEAYQAAPATRDGRYTTQFRSSGMTVLGKSRMPEFGFNATTEFMTAPPARNPWQPGHSVGASSGGAAAMVAAGVVPIAHANDGGGSIRIPAACAGLVGLKPSRGRHVDGEQARHLPINMVSEGVLTRSVRDTAAFVAAAEDYWRNPDLPPIGQVLGPAPRRLRIGIVIDSVTGAAVDDATRSGVERTAGLLEKAGHVVEPVELPVGEQFAADFVQYWGLLAELALDTAKIMLSRSFDVSRADGLSRGLRDFHRKHLYRTPGALRRLRQIPHRCAELVRRHDVLLSPVLSRTAPALGELSPTVPFDELIHRLKHWVAYTPLQNISGQPAISVPTGLDATGLPTAVMMTAAHGDERTLLELAFLLEAEQPFPRIQG